tara:strand:+ start:90 stop:284 length:195 start_codon:yes stop_codon:yes gene_type:complete
MTIQKTKVKRIFNEQGVQLSADVMDNLNYEIVLSLTKMALRCKDNKIKRLTPQLMGYALGNYNL